MGAGADALMLLLWSGETYDEGRRHRHSLEGSAVMLKSLETSKNLKMHKHKN